MIVLVLLTMIASARPDTLVEYHTSAYRCLCTRRNCIYKVVVVAGGRRDTLEVSDFDYEPSRAMPWPAHLSRWKKMGR